MVKDSQKISETLQFTFDVRWVFIGSIIAFIIRFFQKPITARFVGADGIGLWAMALVFYGIFAIVGGWQAAGMPKFVAEYKGNKSKLRALIFSGIINALAFGIIFGFLLYIISDLLASIFDMPLLSPLLKIVSISLPFSFVATVLLATLQGLRKMKWHSLIEVFQHIFAFSVIVILLIYGFDVIGIAIGTVLAWIIALFLLYLFTKDLVKVNVKDYRKHTKNLLFYGVVSVLATMIAMTLIFKIDILMTAYFLKSEEELGYYSTALGFFNIMWMIPYSINKVSYPTASAYWAKNKYKQVRKLINRSLKYSCIVLILGSIFLLFFGPDIIWLLFGSEFLPTVVPLNILIFGLILFGISASIASIFGAVGRPEIGLIINIFVCGPNIILNYILIPRFGIAGTALATTITFSFFAFLRFYYTIKVVKTKLDSIWFIKICLGTILITAIFFLLYNIVNKYLIGGILFLGFLYIILTRFMTQEDRKNFLALLKLH